MLFFNHDRLVWLLNTFMNVIIDVHNRNFFLKMLLTYHRIHFLRLVYLVLNLIFLVSILNYYYLIFLYLVINGHVNYLLFVTSTIVNLHTVLCAIMKIYWV